MSIDPPVKLIVPADAEPKKTTKKKDAGRTRESMRITSNDDSAIVVPRRDSTNFANVIARGI
jgi:hypothetical protein